MTVVVVVVVVHAAVLYTFWTSSVYLPFFSLFVSLM